MEAARRSRRALQVPRTKSLRAPGRRRHGAVLRLELGAHVGFGFLQGGGIGRQFGPRDRAAPGAGLSAPPAGGGVQLSQQVLDLLAAGDRLFPDLAGQFPISLEIDGQERAVEHLVRGIAGEAVLHEGIDQGPGNRPDGKRLVPPLVPHGDLRSPALDDDHRRPVHGELLSGLQSRGDLSHRAPELARIRDQLIKPGDFRLFFRGLRNRRFLRLAA